MSIEDDFAAFRRVAGEELDKLRKENAALREDKERLDWMASADYWADIAVYRTPQALRAAIDAARKEAQQ